jgi:hypothetical protein
MISRVPYAPVSGADDGQDSEVFDSHDGIPSLSEEIGEQSTRLVCIYSLVATFSVRLTVQTLQFLFVSL